MREKNKPDCKKMFLVFKKLYCTTYTYTYICAYISTHINMQHKLSIKVVKFSFEARKTQKQAEAHLNLTKVYEKQSNVVIVAFM